MINPNGEEKCFEFEAKKNDAVIIGNGEKSKYTKFEIDISPVVNRLSKEELGKIDVDFDAH